MKGKRQQLDDTVVFLNPKTCGVYKDGGTRYVVDSGTGRRSTNVDDELNTFVDAWLAGKSPPGEARITLEDVAKRQVLVPTYYDPRYEDAVAKFLGKNGLASIALGTLMDNGILTVRGGHGSPGNDQRIGTVPYIKVSDLRALRVNINPTNLIPEGLAKEMWRGEESGLRPWDLLSPNRASSNIGEFCILLPGEERIVMTKEVYVLRVGKSAEGWDPFYLLWALSLKPVRKQWSRIALMQTNREDVGDRYREVIVPQPKSPAWAREVSAPFRDYFTSLASAREKFGRLLKASQDAGFEYIASIAEMARK